MGREAFRGPRPFPIINPHFKLSVCRFIAFENEPHSSQTCRSRSCVLIAMVNQSLPLLTILLTQYNTIPANPHRRPATLEGIFMAMMQ